MDMYTQLYLKWMTNKDLLYSTKNSAQQLCGSLAGRGVWGRMDTCICMAEAFPCSLKTVTTLLIGIQFSSVQSLKSCPTLCDPMNRNTPGLPVHHHLPEFTQTHVHWVSDAIQSPHPLSSPSSPALNPSQHQSLFQWVYSSHEVAKVLEFQL